MSCERNWTSSSYTNTFHSLFGTIAWNVCKTLPTTRKTCKSTSSSSRLHKVCTRGYCSRAIPNNRLVSRAACILQRHFLGILCSSTQESRQMASKEQGWPIPEIYDHPHNKLHATIACRKEIQVALPTRLERTPPARQRHSSRKGSATACSKHATNKAERILVEGGKTNPK